MVFNFINCEVIPYDQNGKRIDPMLYDVKLLLINQKVIFPYLQLIWTLLRPNRENNIDQVHIQT
jgi:hypothetical protein